MTHGGHETHEGDPHSMLFGADEHGDGEHDLGAGHPGDGRSRRRQHRRRKRNQRVLIAMVLALVAIVTVTVVVAWSHISDLFGTDDYTGSGTGAVTVEVHSGDGASMIGDELKSHGVVASSQAFIDAAANNPDSTNIQPGSYTLPKRLPAKTALAYLLDGKHVARGVVVPEGATVVDIEKRLQESPCKPDSPKAKVCGIGVTEAQAKQALADVAALGLPTDYLSGGKAPISAEGFLYPLTYTFGGDTSAGDALQHMVSAFTDQVRTSGFTADAKAMHLTPYEALIIASIEQSEAYFPDDMPKVARVILNRLAADMPLQIDATSAYAAKLKGLDPTKVIYSDIDGPYNTYKHDGLPPTPISNPGQDALDGAVHPAKGNWLYYVNADKAGHLFFTNDEQAFADAVEKCRDNNWGCG